MLGSLISKIAGRKETPTQVFSYAYCEFFNVYFEKHLRTAASDYSDSSSSHVLLIIMVILLLYIFAFGCLSTIDYDLYGEVCSLKLDIMQSNDVFFKGHVKIAEIYMVKFNVSVLHRLRITVFF